MRSALLLLAACGRVGFDERAVATDAAVDVAQCVPLTAHDEDGDGVADSCDVCPHIAGAHTDRDGDGVGDACDLQPENPRQRIVVFDPLTSITGWTTNGTVSVGSDSVKLGGLGQLGGRIAKAFVPATDAITIGVRTMAVGNGQYLFAVMFVETFAPARSVYCEDFSDGVDTSLLVTYTLDGSSFVHDDSAVAPPIANSAGRLTAAIDATSIACSLAWNAPPLDAAGPRPPQIVPQTLALYAENIQLELDYVLQIRTDP